MDQVFKDAFNLLCGDLIGEGIHRKVYACKLRPEYVVKVEHEENYRYFANVMEMKIWNEFENNEKVSSWLAPCGYLSPDGRLLLQRKAEPVRQTDNLPDTIPYFLADVKKENFGFINGTLVCVDYAMIMIDLKIRQRPVIWH